LEDEDVQESRIWVIVCDLHCMYFKFEKEVQQISHENLSQQDSVLILPMILSIQGELQEAPIRKLTNDVPKDGVLVDLRNHDLMRCAFLCLYYS
jgi:hypothetical protein